jgi:hypothetical protein
MATYPSIILSQWQNHFENLQFSSQEFYDSVEKIIKEREIPDITLKRVTFSQKGLFSAKREYLRVKRNEYVFDICAAPFGKGFFISWWLGEQVGFMKDLLARIPVIGVLFVAVASRKTYYQADTEAMFRESIRLSVLKAIDDLVAYKGIRALSEIERQPTIILKGK